MREIKLSVKRLIACSTSSSSIDCHPVYIKSALMKRTSFLSIIVVFSLNPVLQAAVPGLLNPGFDAQDASGGDISPSSGWFGINYGFVTQSVPAHSAPNTLRAYGPYYATGASGAFQGDFPASPGEAWRASAWARIDSSDPMNPANMALVVLRFLPDNNFDPGILAPPITTATLPLNTWQEFSAVGVAPPGTTAVRIQLLHVQLSPSASNGSIFFDDASLQLVPEPTSAVLAAICWIGCCGIGSRRSR